MLKSGAEAQLKTAAELDAETGTVEDFEKMIGLLDKKLAEADSAFAGGVLETGDTGSLPPGLVDDDGEYATPRNVFKSATTDSRPAE